MLQKDSQRDDMIESALFLPSLTLLIFLPLLVSQTEHVNTITMTPSSRPCLVPGISGLHGGRRGVRATHMARNINHAMAKKGLSGVFLHGIRLIRNRVADD